MRWATWYGADACTDGPEAGAKALLAWMLVEYPQGWSGGIYNCRGVRGSTTTSIHGEGRAVDLMLPMLNGRGLKDGHDLVKRLGAEGSRLGVQCVIYDRRIWSATSPEGRYYGGVHPHYDHLHIELTPAAGQNLTLATLRAVLGTRHPAPLEDDVYAVKFEQQDNYVRRLQKLMNAASEPSGAKVQLREDGQYGPLTAAAVNTYASRAGMPEDGETGCHVLVVDYLRNWLR